MEFRSPTSEELALWKEFRNSCLSNGHTDPGPAPQQWPVDESLSKTIRAVLQQATGIKELAERLAPKG